MAIHMSIPKDDFDLKPKITVIGVGGAGGNAVNNMIRANLQGIEFVVANADAQALAQSGADVVIWGSSAERNIEAEATLLAHGVRVLAQTVDVSNEKAVVTAMVTAACDRGHGCVWPWSRLREAATVHATACRAG
jgi:cell division protein FtsZ